jgi:hypothetical protein
MGLSFDQHTSIALLDILIEDYLKLLYDSVAL